MHPHPSCGKSLCSIRKITCHFLGGGGHSCGTLENDWPWTVCPQILARGKGHAIIVSDIQISTFIDVHNNKIKIMIWGKLPPSELVGG